MNELKEGGLALVIDGLNTGKVVHLLEHHDKVTFDDGIIWKDVWLIEGSELLNVYCQPQPHVLIMSKYLKPIGDSKFTDKLIKATNERGLICELP